MTNSLDQLKQLRTNAPKPFGLYSATCIGLDGGLATYTQNFQETNFTDFSAGLKVYRNSTFIPQQSDYKVIKQEGRVKLLEYASEGEPILLIPSLVNKHYIFDLYEENSLIKHLISQGKRPFVIDWGTPTSVDDGFGLYELIEDYIVEFSRFLNYYTNSKIDLLGYCMGASFALIAASLKQKLYNNLTLVALPYNFNEMPFTGMIKASKELFKQYLKIENVKSDWIQSLFYMLDPMAVINRIKYFAEVKDTEQLNRMIALEDWLSDCIDVDAKIAIEIMDLWYGQNKLYYKDLDLSKLDLSVTLVTAKKDVIVPNAASTPIISKVKKIKHIEVDSGHIGIMIGRKSITQFYEKLDNKLLSDISK